MRDGFPELGDERTVTKFLWRPRKVEDRWRWLETLRSVECYAGGYGWISKKRFDWWRGFGIAPDEIYGPPPPSEELEQVVTEAEEKLTGLFEKAVESGVIPPGWSWEEAPKCRAYEEALAAADKELAEQMARPKPKREGAEQWTCEPPTEDGYYWVVETNLRTDISDRLGRYGGLEEALQELRESPGVERAEVSHGMVRVGNGPDWRLDSPPVKEWLWHKSGRIIAPEPPSCDPVALSKTLRAGVSMRDVMAKASQEFRGNGLLKE